MGSHTKASGYISTAMGWITEASGDASTAIGYETQAGGDYQTVIGKYNVKDSSEGGDSSYLFIVGNGTSSKRSDAFRVSWTGKLKSNGNFPISDRRLKTEIETIKKPLDKILKLRGVSYRWIPEERRTHGYRREIGLIAQEVEKIVPELVSTDKDPDSKGRYLKSVAYEKTVGLLIEGIKEQQKQINELKVENKNLLKRIQKLEEVILK